MWWNKTDTAALNFDPLANTDDGSCTYPVILGSTAPSEFNYNPAANVDDGSCIPVFYGCTDPLALNYEQRERLWEVSLKIIGGFVDIEEGAEVKIIPFNLDYRSLIKISDLVDWWIF